MEREQLQLLEERNATEIKLASVYHSRKSTAYVPMRASGNIVINFLKETLAITQLRYLLTKLFGENNIKYSII
jgi:hypothetical protein